MKQKDEILTQSFVKILFCEILTLILMRLKSQNNEITNSIMRLKKSKLWEKLNYYISQII